MKTINLNLFLIITTFILPIDGYPQIGDKTTPYSFNNDSCKSISQINKRVLQTNNNDSLREIDSLYHLNSSGFPAFTFATSTSLSLNVYNFMTWDTVNNETMIGRIKLKSPDALSSFLIFDSFHLPKRVKLYAYNESKSQVLGAFTSRNNKEYGGLSLGPVVDDNIIIELVKPIDTDTSSIQLHLEAYIHGYKDIFLYQSNSKDLTIGTSESCNINVKCPEGSGWCNQRRSVAMIVALDPGNNNFSQICTGSLTTNEKRDLKPYFLTANHCQVGKNVNDWIFLFNYQSSNCGAPSSQPNTSYTISSASLSATRYESDFALLELSNRPPVNYNTYYAGWDNENDKPKDGVSIHHPSGDIKKISTYSKKPKRRTSSGRKLWKVKFDDGVVEHGSSGSPHFIGAGITYYLR